MKNTVKKFMIGGIRYSAIALIAMTTTIATASEMMLDVDWLFRKEGESEWRRVSVPHCVNAHDTFDGHAGAWGEKDQWRGRMEYKKRFSLPQGSIAKAFLEIEAIRQTARVKVNGVDCGFYDAGIAACGFDITSALKDGENEVIIETDNLTASEGGADYQWNEASFNPVQGGLTGHVKLHIKPHKTYITLPLLSTLGTTGVYVWADDFDFAKGAATIHVDAQVAGADQHTMRFSVNGQTFDGVVGRVENLVFWSPDTPRLYDVKVELLGEDGATLDAMTIRTGFRKVEYDIARGGLLINGKNYYLQGYAQRSVNCWAAIGLPVDWLQDWEMSEVRESNANHIRWMHVAAKPNAIRSCDKFGVVATCPAGDKESESKGKYWEQRVEAMRDVVVYFRNSPSVLFWEAGNNQISPSHMREMRLVKEKYDPKGGRFMGCRTLQTPEQIAEAEYVGTMINRHDAGAFASMKRLGRYLPITETEFCREEAPRRIWDDFTPPDFDYVNLWLGRGNRQNGFDAHDKTQEDIARSNASDSGWTYFWGNRVGGPGAGYYTGAAMLCWSDMVEMGRNSASENCRVSGRVDASRIRKENFYVLKTIQSESPAIKILGHWSYPPDTPENYRYHNRTDTGHHWEWTDEVLRRDPKHKTVYVTGSRHVASMELFVNGASKGVKTGPERHSIFTWAWEDIDITESGAIEAVARDTAGNIIARDRIETVGKPARISAKITTGPQGWIADGADIAMVDLALVDDAGRVHPYANDKLTFSLDFHSSFLIPHPSSPIFMGGYNSGTFRDDEKKPSPVGENWVRLECGVARVFIKAGFTPGNVTLRAKCENGMYVEVKLNTVLKTTCDSVEDAAWLEWNAQGEIVARGAPKADYADRCDVPAVREYKPKGENLPPYTVLVNGVKVDFHRDGAKPVKPDDNTGVVAPYRPILNALKAAGADVDYEYVQNPTKVNKLPPYLRAFKPPYLKVIASGHIIDCVKGETVLYYDGGEEKNLANCELFEDKRHELVGELVALLQYLKDVKVSVDDAHRIVELDVCK